ncbi:hypothetical protein [Leucobacter chromiireducens]|uniref:Single-stranded DNA-binding protein n=1 Tax=Leucobacter chromiireducens subsp. solipictus TaxID=398235 RepID=A0ABS1SJ80_9MICO|nr:hypothetical protein [Leucobacter chromiireducens]MBL3680614.1 hypothetical protein [Leucobacter chromiireducens subsp. solipictus]
MSEMQHAGTGGVALSKDVLAPSVQRIGRRDIEITFLGTNSAGQPTWIMWNADEPYLIGMLSQGKMGYRFEQRTSSGAMVHENISLSRVQRALGG